MNFSTAKPPNQSTPSPALLYQPAVKPVLAITLGDPTGIGPEIVVGALRDPMLYEICRPLVIGRSEILRRACRLLKNPAEVRMHGDVDPSQATPDCLVCHESGEANAEDAPPCVIDARGGKAAYDFLVEATRLALGGEVQAIVTAPLHKAALHAAGYDWPGHTELLAHLCGVEQFAMMLYLPPGGKYGGPAGLGMVHVTLHMALREIFDHLSTEAVFEKIQLAHDTFTRLYRGLASESPQREPLPSTNQHLSIAVAPSIAVAALNPHGGESGLFGDEESKLIRPAVEKARGLGWNVSGPWPVDTLMPKAARGEYDAVVVMYHDQGHITLKLLDMFDAVNITLGLPIIRTSVAHGTAHDQAWKGTAGWSGMLQALKTAAWLARSQAIEPATGIPLPS